jgi:hypothetical protein
MQEILKFDAAARAATGQFVTSIFGDSLPEEPPMMVRPAAPPAATGTIAERNTTESGAISERQIQKARRLERIVARVVELDSAFYEEFGRRIDPRSVVASLMALRRLWDLPLPMLSAEPSGLLIATWRRGREVVTVRFLDTARAHYALAVQSAADASIERSWGSSHPITLLEQNLIARAIVRNAPSR